MKTQKFFAYWQTDLKRPQLSVREYFLLRRQIITLLFHVSLFFITISLLFVCFFVPCLSVPEFVVAQPNCSCKEEQIGLICRIQRCSIKAWGEVYTFEFLEDHTLLSSSFVISHAVNSSFSLIKRFSGNCFAGGNLLAPPGAECRVTYCEGQLVSMHWTYQLFCEHLQPLQASNPKHVWTIHLISLSATKKKQEGYGTRFSIVANVCNNSEVEFHLL